MLTLLFQLVVVGVIFAVLWWFVSYVGLPAPFDKVARVVIGLVAVIYLVSLLMSIGGVDMPSLRLR